jgi:glycosyltransferase involved in cell wall biosynthesis
VDQLAHHIRLLELVRESEEEFDLIHYHIDYLHFPLSRLSVIPQATTLHGRLDIPDLQSLYEKFPDMPLISISQAQRKPLPGVNWVGNVYHGLPADLLKPTYEKGKYFAFLGRVSIEKGLDHAIHIAEHCGIPLKIAAKIDVTDKAYYEKEIKPLLDHPLIEFVGEINEREKERFLGGAMAMLFPIRWAEPFGLVMIEAMACGTPIVAYGQGSVPEVIEHGVSGFIVRNEEEAVRAIKIDLPGLDRRRCRRAFEQRFTAQHMAENYLGVYQRLINNKIIRRAS